MFSPLQSRFALGLQFGILLCWGHMVLHEQGIQCVLFTSDERGSDPLHMESWILNFYNFEFQKFLNRSVNFVPRCAWVGRVILPAMTSSWP